MSRIITIFSLQGERGDGMKVMVLSGNLVKVDLEYQINGLNEENIRELIRLLEKSVFKMRELKRKEVESKNQVVTLFSNSVA